MSCSSYISRSCAVSNKSLTSAKLGSSQLSEFKDLLDRLDDDVAAAAAIRVGFSLLTPSPPPSAVVVWLESAKREQHRKFFVVV